MKAKVQTTDNNSNVIVQIKANASRHYHSSDRECTIVRVLNSKDIEAEATKIIEKMSSSEKEALFKPLLMKQPNFATSNVATDVQDYPKAIIIKHGDIVEYSFFGWVESKEIPLTAGQCDSCMHPKMHELGDGRTEPFESHLVCSKRHIVIEPVTPDDIEGQILDCVFYKEKR